MQRIGKLLEVAHYLVLNVAFAMTAIIAAVSIASACRGEVPKIQIGFFQQLLFLPGKDSRLFLVYQGNAGFGGSGISSHQGLQMKTRIHDDGRLAQTRWNIQLLPDSLLFAGARVKPVQCRQTLAGGTAKSSACSMVTLQLITATMSPPPTPIAALSSTRLDSRARAKARRERGISK